MTCASLWRYYNVRVVQCIIIMASKIVLMLSVPFEIPETTNKKKKNSAYQGQRERWNEKIRHEPYAIRHRLLPRNNNTTSHQQQQPAPRDNNLLKCKGKMDMMGKFLTRSNRSKTRRKTRWRWRCVGFHLFLSAVQFSVCFNVQNCCCGCCCWNSSRVCSSSQHKSMQICPLSVRVHHKMFYRFGHPKLKIRKLRIIG